MDDVHDATCHACQLLAHNLSSLVRRETVRTDRGANRREHKPGSLAAKQMLLANSDEVAQALAESLLLGQICQALLVHNFIEFSSPLLNHLLFRSLAQCDSEVLAFLQANCAREVSRVVRIM